jgi:hypothetical protein
MDTQRCQNHGPVRLLVPLWEFNHCLFRSRQRHGPFSVLGASGDPAVPGMGFRFDTNECWQYPNPTGLDGVMEGYCPPHLPDMRTAVEALCERKFGPGGPFQVFTRSGSFSQHN